MKIVTRKITEILNKKNLTRYKLSKLAGFSEGALGLMITEKKAFSEKAIQKIAPVLEISPEIIKGWVLADKYPKKVLQRALELKQEFAGRDELIFKSKMHELMNRHGLTINPFAKVIGYNQGWLSQVVLGKEPVSRKLVVKLCDFSGVCENEITSWSVADKYSQEALQTALNGYT